MISDGYRSNATRWVDRILSAHWDRIEKKVGPDWMPSLKGGRGKRVVIEEYGCGHYGCVAPTNARDIVFKMTSDGTEAAFVAQALKIGSWPEGIVRYAAIYRLPDESHRKRSVYVLWREEAYDIGGLIAAQYDPVVVLAKKRITQFLEWARDARKRLENAQSPSKMLVEARGMKDWAEDAVPWDEVDKWPHGYMNCPMPRSLTGARALAWDVRACEIIAEQMDQEDVGYLIGRAFQFYMEHDMLLADVHLENIGHVERDEYSKAMWAITDPGHMVPLSPARMDFVVEEL